MVEWEERKKRDRKVRKDGDEEGWECQRVGGDDVWIGDARG
jgi:hypothetical protein